MANLRVRPAKLDDHAVVIEFNRRLASETEEKKLAADVLAKGVRAALADRERLAYWVAEIDGVVVGQAGVTREWSDWRNGWIWWLQSVYVRDDNRGQGVFRELFAAIETAARAAQDVIGLRLYVDRDNLAAQKTYDALGMSAGNYAVYEQFWIDLP